MSSEGEKYCVGPEDRAKGIDTIKGKLEADCPHFARMDVLFGGRQNVTPACVMVPDKPRQAQCTALDDDDDSDDSGDEEMGDSDDEAMADFCRAYAEVEARKIALEEKKLEMAKAEYDRKERLDCEKWEFEMENKMGVRDESSRWKLSYTVRDAPARERGPGNQGNPPNSALIK